MKNLLYAFGAILCWASLPAATGSGLNGLSTPELMFYSFTSAALWLYLQDGLVEKRWRPPLPSLPLALLGVWGIFLYHWLYYLALDRAPLAEGAILATTWSFWIVIFSALLRFRRLHPAIVVTAAVGMSGAALVIAAGKELSFSSSYMTGYALALLCGLLWSSFSVALSHFRVPQAMMTTYTIVAALLSLSLFLLEGGHSLPQPKALLSAIYLGAVPLGLSFYLWSRAVDGGNMVIIGFLSYLTPPLAVLLVALIHGEKINSQVLVGMAVIIAAALGGRIFLQRAEKREGV